MCNIELPHCDRCCCCLPIRQSIIVWAFLKMIIFTLPIAGLLLWVIYVRTYWEYVESSEIFLLVSSIALMLINCSVTVFCIIAMLLRRRKLMTLFLRCEVRVIVANTAFIIISSIMLIIEDSTKKVEDRHDLNEWLIILLWIIFFFIFIGSQVYVALLVRSKLKLIADKEGFSFQNNSADAVCTYYGHYEGIMEGIISNNGMPDNSKPRDESRYALKNSNV